MHYFLRRFMEPVKRSSYSLINSLNPGKEMNPINPKQSEKGGELNGSFS